MFTSNKKFDTAEHKRPLIDKLKPRLLLYNNSSERKENSATTCGLTLFRKLSDPLRSEITSYFNTKDLGSLMTVSRDIWAGRAKHYGIELKSNKAETWSTSGGELCPIMPLALIMGFFGYIAGCAKDSCCSNIRPYSGTPITFLPPGDYESQAPLHISSDLTIQQAISAVKSLGIKKYRKVSLAANLSRKVIIGIVKDLPRNSKLILPVTISESAVRILVSSLPNYGFRSKIIIPLEMPQSTLLTLVQNLPSDSSIGYFIFEFENQRREIEKIVRLRFSHPVSVGNVDKLAGPHYRAEGYGSFDQVPLLLS